jgi:hypothetical protein
VISTDALDTFDVQQLRHATALNEKLTHEMAVLKRLKAWRKAAPRAQLRDLHRDLAVKSQDVIPG